MTSFSGIIAEATRMLDGVEAGNMPSADAFNIADKLDPTIVYFIIRFLREKYPPSDPAAQGVTERLVELSSTYDSIVKACKEGENDPVTEWFNDTYNMREWFDKPNEFVELIVEKIEG